MFIVDDILLSPAKGIFWIFQEIHKIAQDEQANESDVITADLRDLYLVFEAGKITEAEFDTREKELLDQLDRIQEA